MKWTPVVIGAVIVAILLAAALTVWALQNNKGQLNARQYAFLEHSTETVAMLAGDNNTTDAYRYLGYPTYNASQTAAFIQKNTMLPRINDSLKAIFQEGNSVGKAGCHGTQLNISGVYQFPYDSDSSHLRILTVDGDGVAYLIYDGQPVIINPKESWYANQTVNETVLANATSGQTIEVNLTITDRITNYGIYDK